MTTQNLQIDNFDNLTPILLVIIPFQRNASEDNFINKKIISEHNNNFIVFTGRFK